MARVCHLALVFVAFIALPNSAFAQTTPLEGWSLQQNLDLAWIMVAAALVLLMQVGFLLLESGMVRSKNSINVAQKNLIDFASSVLIFAAIGFAIAFGASTSFFVGFQWDFVFLDGLDQWGLAFFTFQVMFCGAAATIVSGAVAERMRLYAYAITSLFIAGLAYPVFVHWAWGSALMENSGAFLANMGFVDFAGSTVVHGTGAWIALAACIVIGARDGRFDKHGKPVRFQGHSPVLATAGAFLLFVGWLGFNGGSTLSATSDVAIIIANTVLAAGAGAFAGFWVGMKRYKIMLPEHVFSGMLGGLVAITAGCHIVGPAGALAVGLLGGALAIWGNSLLESRFRIDDAVGAIGVHGVAGVVGTLALVFFAPVEDLPLGNRFDQFAVQLTGVLVNFVWCCGLGLVFFTGLRGLMSLRTSTEDEIRGLNQAEHGTRMGIGHVEDAVSDLLEGKADLRMRLPSEPGDDAERMTVLFNRLMNSIENEELRRAHNKETAIRDEESERLHALANATFEAIIISRKGRVIDGNHALATLVGAPLDTLKGRSLYDMIPQADHDLLTGQLKKSNAEPYEIRLLGENGTNIPVEARAREIIYQGETTRISAIVDLRERKASEDRIRFLAQHDPITNLPNRAVFSRTLNELLHDIGETGQNAAVFLIDLDRFKDINDIHGHLVGDCVIEESARRIATTTRKGDLVARIGGDEFAIIVPSYDFKSQLEDLAHRLVQAFQVPIDCLDGLFIRTSISVGVSIAPEHGDNPSLLVSTADTALYRAKSLGRNRYCVFEAGMNAETTKRRDIEAELSKAVQDEQFVLHYQPRLDARTFEITGYEALIRWNHPEKGLVYPGDFIPVAEQSSRIIEIGNWVIAEACRTAKQELGDARVSVNVSPLQFRDKDFVKNLAATLAHTRVDPERLEIELTESLLIDDADRALAIIKSIKDAGVKVALDDFGTGYSSLGYLSQFPFDSLKIDRSFVQRMTESQSALAIVDTIIDLGNALGMQVVAEGIENIDEVAALLEKGCDEMQGYLIGKPVSIDKVRRSPPEDLVSSLNDIAATCSDTLRGKLRERKKDIENAA